MAVRNCITVTNNNRQELSHHGTLSFPAAAYDVSSPVLLHWHDELEALCVIHGRCEISAGTHRIILEAGEGLFINGGVIHSAESIGESFRIHSLVFHSDLICGNDFSILREKYILPFTKCIEFLKLPYESSCYLLSAWESFHDEGFCYEFIVREKLSRMLLPLFRYNRTSAVISPSQRRQTERVKLMLTFIRGHFHEDINTNDIAESASISASECLRCFHNVLNTTPAKYLKHYRLTRAERLIASTDINISEAAYMCGFNDVSYFTRIFHEKNETTPSQFRIDNLNPNHV